MKDKNFIRIMDIMIFLAIIMSVSCIFITQYLISKQHGGNAVVIEMNPNMRETFNNVETFESLPEGTQEAINYKWKFYRMISLNHVIIIAPYLLFRRKIKKEKMTDEFALYCLFTFAVGLFLINLLNFANDFGYILGRVL